jgi:O-antigen ligase
MRSNGWIPGLEDRAGGTRVASTTGMHVEFGVVMAMCLPFAVHLARFGPSIGRRRAFVVASLLITVAVPTSISRTGIVAAVLVLVVMMTVWTWRMRYNVLVLLAGLAAAAIATVRPALDVFVELFAGVVNGRGITARTERYGVVLDYLVQRPWFGRGTGTWASPQYQDLDNQWLAFALTNGVVGVTALLGVHVTAMALAWTALRRSTSEADRHLCAALISTQVVAVVVGFFFDSLSFYTYVLVMALVVGLCGAVWRFTHPARTVRTSMVGTR